MHRQVLADNLKALIAAQNPPLSDRALGRAAGIDAKTVTRIKDMKHAASIDTLASLATYFGLLPWQLLVPGMDPTDPPLTQLSRTETALYRKLQIAASDFGKLDGP